VRLGCGKARGIEAVKFIIRAPKTYIQEIKGTDWKKAKK